MSFLIFSFSFQTIHVVTLSTIFIAVTFVLFSLLRDYWLLFISAAVHGVSVGVFITSAFLLPHDIVGTTLFPTAIGVLNTVYGIGSTTSGPLLGISHREKWKDLTQSYDKNPITNRQQRSNTILDFVISHDDVRSYTWCIQLKLVSHHNAW